MNELQNEEIKENNKEQNFEILSDKNNKFKIVFTNKNNSSLIITAYYIEKSENIFEKTYSLEEIKKYKIFIEYNSIDKILDEIYKLIDNKNVKILENNDIKIYLVFLKSNDKLIFSLDIKLTDKELINEQQKKIVILEKNLKQLETNFNEFKETKEKEIKDLIIFYKENKYIEEEKIIIKYSIGSDMNKKEIICDKYMLISELKEKINSENGLKKNEYELFFCGQILNNKLKIKDLKINKYPEEIINFLDKNDLKIIHLFFNNMKTEFYFQKNDYNKSFYLLQKYIFIYYKIPKQNQLLFYYNNSWLKNKKEKLTKNIISDYIKEEKGKSLDIYLEYISDLDFIKINIKYKKGKEKKECQLEVSRFSNCEDLIHYLSQYSLIPPENKKYPIFIDKNGKRIDVLCESNIMDDDEIYLNFMDNNLYSKIYSKESFQIYIDENKHLFKIPVCSDITIEELKIIIDCLALLKTQYYYIIYQGKILNYDKLLKEYDISANNTLYIQKEMLY